MRCLLQGLVQDPAVYTCRDPNMSNNIADTTPTTAAYRWAVVRGPDGQWPSEVIEVAETQSQAAARATALDAETTAWSNPVTHVVMVMTHKHDGIAVVRPVTRVDGGWAPGRPEEAACYC